MDDNQVRSASALQIEEKHQRMEEMLTLATQLTRIEIAKALEQNPNLTEEELWNMLTKEGIKIVPFLHTYITRISVSWRIAHEYFEHQSEGYNPKFISFGNRPDLKDIRFHLGNDELLSLIRERKPKTGD